MGRPRGEKAKRPTSQATKNQDAADAGTGSGDEEAVIPAYKRRGGRPQRHLKDKADDTDEEEGGAIAKVEEPAEDSDGAKPPAKGSAENGGSKRRRRQPKRVFEPATKRDGHPAKQSGFRHHGSRRKSTPRRAAEAGVECK